MAGLKADEYSKFDTMREHVLAIPATYIGSDKPMVRDEYVFDFETKKVKKVSIDIPEGVCRVLIEILSKAIKDWWTRFNQVPLFTGHKF